MSVLILTDPYLVVFELFLSSFIILNIFVLNFIFLKCLQSLSIEINLFLPVNANISWLIMLLAQFSETDCR
jgi:hypothetical protein